MLVSTTHQADREFLRDVLRRGTVLTALRPDGLRREELAQRLDISSATAYRYTGWLEEQAMLTEIDDAVALTPLGHTITAELIRFDDSVEEATKTDGEGWDRLDELTQLAPGLQALSNRPLDRRDLEERIGVSKTTGYRITRSLEDHGLVERRHRDYTLTTAGTEVLDAVSTFEANVRTAIRLGAVLEVLRKSDPAASLNAFFDATVTSLQGYVHSPQSRFLELLGETDTLRGLTVSDIAPFYLGEIQQRIEDGLELENIMRPEFVAQQLAEFPDRAIEVCDSDNVSVYLHDDLWFSLVIFDDRIGIGVRDPDTSALQAFVDTAAPAARAWAESVYRSYKAEAEFLPRFDPISLQQVLAERSQIQTESRDG